MKRPNHCDKETWLKWPLFKTLIHPVEVLLTEVCAGTFDFVEIFNFISCADLPIVRTATDWINDQGSRKWLPESIKLIILIFKTKYNEKICKIDSLWVVQMKSQQYLRLVDITVWHGSVFQLRRPQHFLQNHLFEENIGLIHFITEYNLMATPCIQIKTETGN